MDSVNITMLRKWSILVLSVTLLLSLGLLAVVAIFVYSLNIKLLWLLSIIPAATFIFGCVYFIKMRKEIHELELEFFNETFEK